MNERSLAIRLHSRSPYPALDDVDLCRAARLVTGNATQKLSVKATIVFARRKSMMLPKPIEYFAVTLRSASPFLDCDPCRELFVSCAGAVHSLAL